jgi:hypothetical protein
MTRIERLICLCVTTGISTLAISASPTTHPAATQPTTIPSSVLEPAHEATTQPGDQPAEIREGTMIDLIGQITYNAKHEPMFRFRRAEGGDVKTLPILPNRNLERMEDALAANGKDTWFSVSAVAMVYLNHNYLLMRDASLLLEKP